MLDPHNDRLHLPEFEMDYIRFGSGKRVLIMIPGLGDGLKTVKGMALPFSLLYRKMAKDFTVYVFSRRTELTDGMTTRDMAEDQARAMETLGLSNCAVLGVSQGGMIAQWLAIDHPELVDKLVLTVTLSRPNPTVREAIGTWTKMAEEGDYKGIMIDTAKRSYSEKRIRQSMHSYKIFGNVGKPKSFSRFVTQASSCVTHDTWEYLSQITCPTLVIGGSDDRIATGTASEEIAEKIPGCKLYMYDGLGHGLYEEAKDFQQRVMDFCR